MFEIQNQDYEMDRWALENDCLMYHIDGTYKSGLYNTVRSSIIEDGEGIRDLVIFNQTKIIKLVLNVAFEYADAMRIWGDVDLGRGVEEDCLGVARSPEQALRIIEDAECATGWELLIMPA